LQAHLLARPWLINAFWQCSRLTRLTVLRHNDKAWESCVQNRLHGPVA
jgi:hypothetical protein